MRRGGGGGSVQRLQRSCFSLSSVSLSLYRASQSSGGSARCLPPARRTASDGGRASTAIRRPLLVLWLDARPTDWRNRQPLVAASPSLSPRTSHSWRFFSRCTARENVQRGAENLLLVAPPSGPYDWPLVGLLAAAVLSCVFCAIVGATKRTLSALPSGPAARPYHYRTLRLKTNSSSLSNLHPFYPPFVCDIAAACC